MAIMKNTLPPVSQYMHHQSSSHMFDLSPRLPTIYADLSAQCQHGCQKSATAIPAVYKKSIETPTRADTET